MSESPQSLCEAFQATAAKYPNAPALRSSDGSLSLTWGEYADRVERVAAGLAALGVGRGDTVGLMMTNRPEFHIVDAAAFHLGAVPFSVYNTSAVDQIAYLFGNAENRVVLCEEQFRPSVLSASAGSDVEHVLRVEDLDQLEQGASQDFNFEESWRAVDRDDVVTLIYTSGTTGPPKGVELTHGNVLFSTSTVLVVPQVAEASQCGRVVSYLPDAHLANRWFSHYIPIVTGSEVVTLADTKKIIETLPQVRPTAFLGVPALWYKVKAAIETAVEAEPGVKGRLARWALRTGHQRVAHEAASKPVPLGLRIRHALADRLVLAKFRARIGLDEVIAPVTGAAPISAEALEFVLALGIPLSEGWGMSETCTVGTLNPFDAIRPGTVGTAFGGVDLRLADDGELLLRSPGVMRGYRNDPAKTAEAITPDGWLHTGDIATFDEDGYVRIIDRKKELIVNAAGKNMSPSNIEAALKVASGLIWSVVAIGDQRPYVVALVNLDADAVSARRLDEAAVHAEIAAAVEYANSRLSRVEQIKKFTVLPHQWAPGGDELTPTLKLRRKPISAKYAAQIDALYAETSDRG